MLRVKGRHDSCAESVLAIDGFVIVLPPPKWQLQSFKCDRKESFDISAENLDARAVLVFSSSFDPGEKDVKSGTDVVRCGLQTIAL